MPSRSIVSARSRVAASSSEVSAAPSDAAGARVERPRVVERRARRAGVRAKSVGRASSARARVDISLDVARGSAVEECSRPGTEEEDQ